MKKNIKLYNMVFPVFMLFAFVPGFWLISLAGNFAIDSIVLIIIMLIMFKKIDWSIYKKTIIKIWIFGFISDLIGSLYLVLMSILHGTEYMEGKDLLRQIKTGIYLATNHSPHESVWGVIFIVSGILVSAICIFAFNYFISFKRIKISKKQKILSSLSFAIFTAPYAFLLPKEMFY